jgi:hypothetical protein
MSGWARFEGLKDKVSSLPLKKHSGLGSPSLVPDFFPSLNIPQSLFTIRRWAVEDEAHGATQPGPRVEKPTILVFPFILVPTLRMLLETYPALLAP